MGDKHNWYCFNIRPGVLSAFLKLVSQHDEMGGNDIISVHYHKELKKYAVVFKRTISYGYITNIIEEFAKGHE